MPRHNLDETPEQSLEEQKVDQTWEKKRQKTKQEFTDKADEEFSQHLSKVFWISLGLFALGFFLLDLSIDNDSGLFYLLGLGSGALGHLGLVYWAIMAFFHYTGI